MVSADAGIEMGITADERSGVARGLSRLLADTYTLYLKTHNYHWNVTGPMFASLHLMFETEYMELALAVDEIAERIRALGVRAPASYREFSALATIAEDVDTPGRHRDDPAARQGQEVRFASPARSSPWPRRPGTSPPWTC